MPPSPPGSCLSIAACNPRAVTRNPPSCRCAVRSLVWPDLRCEPAPGGTCPGAPPGPLVVVFHNWWEMWTTCPPKTKPGARTSKYGAQSGPLAPTARGPYRRDCAQQLRSLGAAERAARKGLATTEQV